MTLHLNNQLSFFKPVKIPVYIRAKIQECAIKHLELRDMGQLRDRMEGQLYYDRLKDDINAEFAFEKYLRLGNFDWNKRLDKNYRRKLYEFNSKKLNLILFDGESFPRIDINNVNLCVFVYVYSEAEAWVSGLANNRIIIENGILKGSNIFEIQSFKDLIPFSTNEELLVQINNF